MNSGPACAAPKRNSRKREPTLAEIVTLGTRRTLPMGATSSISCRSNGNSVAAAAAGTSALSVNASDTRMRNRQRAGSSFIIAVSGSMPRTRPPQMQVDSAEVKRFAATAGLPMRCLVLT